MVFTEKKSKLSFYLIVYTPWCASDIINYVAKTDNEHHGVAIYSLTCEALEGQKQKVLASQNNLVTKMFLTY